MTLAELDDLLREREVSVQIHPAAMGSGFVVYLYAPDDPACIFTEEGDDLETALKAAVAAWDNVSGSDPPPSPADLS